MKGPWLRRAERGRVWPWVLWGGVALALSGYLAFHLQSANQRFFLPGETTHGHYQIELSCQTCHTPMMGVNEQSCYDCHGADLEAVNDSHPKAKFTNPRNADRVARLDARRCVTCHIEHRSERTGAMGLSLPSDFCFHCHESIGKERPSHQGLGFATCSTAGCHNFHDNTALYEDFLAKHIGEPDIRPEPRMPERDLRSVMAASGLLGDAGYTGSLTDWPVVDATRRVDPETNVYKEWASDVHGHSGVQCIDCHGDLEAGANEGVAATAAVWRDQVDHEGCRGCHEREVEGWLKGKHGMRLALELDPMTPGLARREMDAAAGHRSLSCVSCHGAHRFDTAYAAVDACLTCHQDEHSRNYLGSAHHQRWQEQQTSAGSQALGVSCATCHMPRIVETAGGEEQVRVEHNQNRYFQPNEGMIRTVCLHCHGLGFALDALADSELIQNNFQGRPTDHVPSLDWVQRRLGEDQPIINRQSFNQEGF